MADKKQNTESGDSKLDQKTGAGNEGAGVVDASIAKAEFDAAVAAAVAEQLEAAKAEIITTLRGEFEATFNTAVADAVAEKLEYAKPAFVRGSAEELTAAEAADLVTRTVIVPPKEKGADPTTKEVEIGADEVLAFKDYGDSVTVVTKDGHKFTGEK